MVIGEAHWYDMEYKTKVEDTISACLHTPNW